MGAFDWPRERSTSGAPRWAPFVLLAFLFTQVMFGALLACSDGGPAYADWPTIGHEWIPSSAFALEPIWRNFTEDHATQHLLHRSLGYVVALIALGLAFAALVKGQGPAGKAAMAVGALALFQAALGIQTVISAAPLSLSLAHQAGAALLWAGTIISARASWR
jgi:cytochrome c oxidase assembly protein subunit 15